MSLGAYSIGTTTIGGNLSSGGGLGAVGNAQSTTWNVQQAVGNTRSTSWSVSTKVGNTRSTTWNVQKAIGNSRSTTWNVQKAVGNTRSVSWNVSVKVGNTRATTWNVSTVTPVGNSRTTTWNVQKAVGNTRTATWSVSVKVGNTRSTTWTVSQKVGNTRATTWNVQKAIGNTRSTTWTVSARVGNSRSTTWKVSVKVGNTRSATWNVSTSGIGNARTTTWNVQRAVGNTRTVTLSVSATAGNTRSTTWAVLKAVGNSRSTTWNVQKAINSNRLVSWNVQGHASFTRTATWSVSTKAGNSRSTTWKVSKAVPSPRTTTWNLLAHIGNSRSTLWSIPSKAGNLRSTTWSIKKKESATRSLTWNVQKTVGGSKTTSWSVNVVVGNFRHAGWSVRNLDTIVEPPPNEEDMPIKIEPQITLTRFDSDDEALANWERQSWILEVQAAAVGGIEPDVFVFHIGSDTDFIEGDKFECVASVNQMHEIPRNAGVTASENRNIPYYRNSRARIVCRNPVEVEQVWDRLVKDTNSLVKNWSAQGNLRTTMEAKLTATSSNVYDYNMNPPTRFRLDYKPAGIADIVNDRQVITVADPGLSGWLPVSAADPSWRIPFKAAFFYNISQDGRLLANWPPKEPFSGHTLHRNGISLPFDLVYLIDKTTIWWLKFNPADLPDYQRTAGQVQDGTAPWPLDYSTRISPGAEPVILELILFL